MYKTMAKRKLNYTFHNPNTEETINALINFFVDVNKPKVDKVIKEHFSEESEKYHQFKNTNKGSCIL